MDNRYSPPWSVIFWVKDTSYTSPSFTGFTSAPSYMVLVPERSVPFLSLMVYVKIGHFKGAWKRIRSLMVNISPFNKRLVRFPLWSNRPRSKISARPSPYSVRLALMVILSFIRPPLPEAPPASAFPVPAPSVFFPSSLSMPPE